MQAGAGRRLSGYLGVALSVAGCGGPPAATAASESPTSGAEVADTGAATPVEAVGPVLTLGVRLSAGQYVIMESGALMFGSNLFGTLEADGTLRREDGSVLARVARDGTIAIESPDRAQGSSLVARIEGDSLVVVEGHHEPVTVAAIENGTLLRGSVREPVEGLTPDLYRTMLAAHAMMLLMLSESSMPMM